ncbi:MAG: hypothetical protein NVSMB52_03240 [Chloroflexota bacterium]
MRAGDRVLYYLTGLQAFAATCTVVGISYEDLTLIWQSKPGEDYPWRFPICPDVLPSPTNYVKAQALLGQLQFVKKWPIEHWHLAFQGNVHVLPREDFDLVEERLRTSSACHS